MTNPSHFATHEPQDAKMTSAIAWPGGHATLVALVAVALLLDALMLASLSHWRATSTHDAFLRCAFDD